MLLNEFLKEHRKVQELEADIIKHQKDSETNEANQREQIQALTARLDAQPVEIQKMSARLQTNNVAPELVLSDH